MSKLHYDNNLFKMAGIPEWAKYITVDKDDIDVGNGFFSIFENKPIDRLDNWESSTGRAEFVGLETDYIGDCRESLLEKIEEVKPMDFVKGWDSDHEPEDCDFSHCVYGVLIAILGEVLPYRVTVGKTEFHCKYVRRMNIPQRKEK